MKVVILMSSLLALAAPNVVDFYRPCGELTQYYANGATESVTTVGTVASLDVTPCTGMPCEFPRGRNATLSVNFASSTTPATSSMNVVQNYARKQSVQSPEMTIGVLPTTDYEITTARPAVFAHVLNLIDLPEAFPMEQDSCQHFDAACPLAANEQHVYTTSIYVSPSYPSVPVVAEWQLIDQENRAVFCFAVPVLVVD